MTNISELNSSSNLLNLTFGRNTTGSAADLTQSLLQPDTSTEYPESSSDPAAQVKLYTAQGLLNSTFGTSTDITPSITKNSAGQVKMYSAQGLLNATFGNATDNSIASLSQSLLGSESQLAGISSLAKEVGTVSAKIKNTGNNQAIMGMNNVMASLIQNRNAEDPTALLNSLRNMSADNLNSVMSAAYNINLVDAKETGGSGKMMEWVKQASAMQEVNVDTGSNFLAATNKILSASSGTNASEVTLTTLSDFMDITNAITAMDKSVDVKNQNYLTFFKNIQASTDINKDMNSFYSSLTGMGAA
ncbi:MAG: hypothetical protein PHV30_05540 [Candidatus Margulisbacteria bacterium]|nr:hypothetical protein [Candidatus Margulisiibacteriota bacterium]